MVWHYENQTLNPTSSKSTETKTVLMNFKLQNQKPQCPFPTPRSPLNPPALNAGRHRSFPSLTLAVEHDCLSSFLLKQLIKDMLIIIYRCVLLLYVETLLNINITSGWQNIYFGNEFTSSITFPQNSSRDWKGSTKARCLIYDISLSWGPFAKRDI